MQDLWQAHYQILSITFLKEFMKLNVSTDTIRKNVKFAELNINIATFFLSTQTLNMIQYGTNVYVLTKNINKCLMKS